MDMDLAMGIALIMIALAVVVRTVFYGIQVIVEAKSTKKSMKLISKFMKLYEPVIDYIKKAMGDDD